MDNKRGQNNAASFFIILIIFAGGALAIPYLLPFFGISTSPPPPPITQGVIVQSITPPGSVSPLSRFEVAFTLSNNIRGNQANNVVLCMDNLGIFSIVSNPLGTRTACVNVPDMFPGALPRESYSLSSPSNGAYANIPYTQDLGYYLTYSYTTGASQNVEFVSQQSYNSQKYPYFQLFSFGNTAGPVQINTSMSSPAIYGNDAQILLNLDNVGTGIILGTVSLSISMNSSLLNISSPQSFGLTSKQYQNGTIVFSGVEALGTGSTSITLPVQLNQNKMNSLQTSGVPYFLSGMHVSISYNYEVDGFFPVTLNTETYYSS